MSTSPSLCEWLMFDNCLNVVIVIGDIITPSGVKFELSFMFWGQKVQVRRQRCGVLFAEQANGHIPTAVWRSTQVNRTSDGYCWLPLDILWYCENICRISKCSWSNTVTSTCHWYCGNKYMSTLCTFMYLSCLFNRYNCFIVTPLCNVMLI